MLEPTKRDEARKKSTINSTKKGPVNPEQELRELLRKKQMEEENDKKRKLAEEEIKHHLEEFNRSKQREENERKKQKESTRPSSKESEKIIEGKKEGVKEAEQKEKMDEQLPKVTRSPKAKVSIIESKPQSNREESLRAAPQRDESPVNLNVQEGRHRSQLNLPRQEIPATAESQNQNALKFHSNAGPEPMEVQVLKVSSSDLNIGEGQSPYIVNTIKEVTEPDLSIMYPRPRKESRIPSSEVKSHFASNQQLLNKRLFNIQERAESSRAENLKVLEEIRAEELVCRKVPGFGQKLINKHLMTRGDQLEEKPKTMPAKRGTAGTKDLLADESYKLKRAEFVDHREGSHVFDGEYMVFAVQGSLLKDK
jgi:hypothetical protein